MAQPPNVQLATPRQVQLAQRGTIISLCDAVMREVQAVYPRRAFPTATGSVNRPAVLDQPWRRSGTSPGGSSMAGPIGADGTVADGVDGNYWVGWAEVATGATPPQRAVWTPPEPGQERFGRPQTVGWVIDSNVDEGAPPVLRPATWLDVASGVFSSDQVGGGLGRAATPVTGGGGRVMAAPFATAAARTRISPMTVRLWGSDLDDTEELAMWVQTACETLLQGTMSIEGLGVCESGGWVKDEKGSRGLHYVLTVNTSHPVIFSPQYEAVLREFAITTVVSSTAVTV